LDLQERFAAVKIPRTMATQHPDSAARYVGIQEEAEEAVNALSPPPLGLGIEEIMIDFEGKLTPYHQTNQIAQGLLDRGVIPGRDVWITPRISSATEETAFRQLMALMSVIEATYQAGQREPEARVEEVIIPMVQSWGDLVKVRDRIRDVIYLGHKEFRLPYEPDSLQLVPLLEEVPNLLCAADLLRGYVRGSAEQGFGVKRLRVMIGRSDAALSYGHLASALCARIALSQIYQAADQVELEAAPILGAGYLPFRGGVMLSNLERLVSVYPGLKTITIQSGIRYDTGEAAEAVSRIHELLSAEPAAEPRLEAELESFLHNVVGAVSLPYLRTFDKLLNLVRPLSDMMPAQRDRLARKGSAGYARAAAEPKAIADLVSDAELARDLRDLRLTAVTDLPRAISFTGALYSVGLPPELIGLGRGLDEVRRRWGNDALVRTLETYPAVKDDLEWAFRYLNLSVAQKVLPGDAFDEVRQDVELAAELVGVPFCEPSGDYHLLLETIQPMLRTLVNGHELPQADLDLVRSWLARLGVLRGSLG